MNELTFRHEVRESDHEAVAEILRSSGSFREQEVLVGLELLDETLNPRPDTDYLWVLAETEASTLAGFACYGNVPMTEGTFDLYWIAVGSEFRGRGVASRIEAVVVERLQAARARWLIAETSSTPSYHAARRFYERAGYSLLESIADYYREGDDRLTYGKRVDRDRS